MMPNASSLRCATVLGALALAACAVAPAEDAAGRSPAEPVGRVSSPILGGTPSDASQNAVVMLVYSDPSKDKRDICTAVLVAPRLVLTARHCVADAEKDVACRADGTPDNGGAVTGDRAANLLYVFTGTERPDLDPTTWKPAGRGAEVIDDGANNLCNHDLALVLLEKPIATVPVATLRLDFDVQPGDRLLTVGWGVTSTVNEPSTRQQRSGVEVTRVGPDEAYPVLTRNEFAFTESICLGDSGGPVFSETSRAVVGVVSRGGNGRSSTDLASTCTMGVNLATKLSPFRDLIERAFERAGASPIVEPDPDPDAGGGCATAPAKGRSGGGFALILLGLVLAKRRSRAIR
ncbi:MAG: hypothetical protein JWP87_5036 [Labilithrix sp.]|nr:hypothetical protein [Labilithrix sp.]